MDVNKWTGAQMNCREGGPRKLWGADGCAHTLICRSLIWNQITRRWGIRGDWGREGPLLGFMSCGGEDEIRETPVC